MINKKSKPSEKKSTKVVKNKKISKDDLKQFKGGAKYNNFPGNGTKIRAY